MAWTHTDIIQKTKKWDCIYLYGYTTALKKCWWKCPQCGIKFQRAYSDVAKKQKAWCRQCSRKKTNKQFVKECKQFGAIPLDPYSKTTVAIRFRCPNCDNIYSRRPDTILHSKDPKCNQCISKSVVLTRTKTNEEFNNQCKLLDIIPLEQYVTCKTPIKFKCPTCKKSFKRTPYNVINLNQLECLSCTYKSRNRKQTEKNQKRFQQKCKKLNIKALEPYINNTTPINFECPKCKKTFKRTPTGVINQQQLLCRSCSLKQQSQKTKWSFEQAKQHCIQRGWIPLFSDSDYKNTQSKIKMQCKCGRVCYNSLQHIYNTKTCGQCNNPNIGDKFFSITITKVIATHNGGCLIEGVCDCSNPVGPMKFNVLKSGNTKTCGRCNNPKVGEIFGEFTVNKVHPGRTKSCTVDCTCSCGTQVLDLSLHHLINGTKLSCGNCKLRRNGVLTSYTALKLQSIIDDILGCKGIHNCKLDYVGGAVDIFYPVHNLVIEFCGYYYHHNKQTQDELKFKRILKEGYKLLIIKASGNINDLPSTRQLTKILTNDLQHEAQRRTITHSSWNKNKKQQKNRENRRQQQGGGSLINYWSRKDDEWLLQNYIDSTWDTLLKRFPDRNKDTIRVRFIKVQPNKTIRKTRKWTKKEDQYLFKNMNTSIHVLTQELNRTKLAIENRKRKLRKQDINNKPQ
jgi:hypothetical protein